MIARHVRFILVALLVAGAIGCEPTELETLQADLRAAQETISDLTEKNDELAAAVADNEARVEALMALGKKRLDKIPHVTRIGLGKWTGGVDTDGEQGDDKVKVYLTPYDQDGTAIKAAGEVTVQLYDLAADPEDNFLGEHRWTVDELRKQWSSGFMSYHYSLEFPWERRPEHEEITFRVVFVDYLTGSTFKAQTVGRVDLDGSDAETQPAD